MEWFLNLPERVKQVVFAVAAGAVLLLGWQIMGPSSDPSADGGKPKNEEPTQVVTPRDGAPQDSDEPVKDATKGLAEIVLQTPYDANELQGMASQAVQFVEMYDSYRWDADLQKKLDRIEVLLADEHTVPLQDVNPQGPVANSLRQSRAVTAVEPTGVMLLLMSQHTLVFEVDATTTSTSKNIDGQEVAEATYEVTLTNASDGWGVSAFAVTSDDGPAEHE